MRDTSKVLTKSERTRRRILDAAATQFRGYGYTATTLRQIADRAKIKAGSIYYYFNSKDEILNEVLRLGIELVFDAVKREVAAIPAGARHRMRIEAAIRAHLLTLLQYSDYTSANIRIYGQVPRAAQVQNRSVRNAYTRYWNALLREAQEAGEIRAEVDLSLARLFLLGSLNWTVEWYSPKGVPIDKLAQTFCTTLFDGIG